MLIAEQNGQRIEAREAKRGGEFICPKCRRKVILKAGRIVIVHFAHKPPTDCTWARGETREHLESKQIVKDAFVSRGLTAEVEFVVNALPGDRRADVLAWSPKGKKVAVELQHSNIELSEIEARAGTYAREGIAQIWVPFIRASVWKDAVARSGGVLFFERYSPRPFEKWVHGFHGKDGMWMYDPRDKSFWHAKMAGHLIPVPETSWYGEGGEEMTAGGGDRWSKRYR